MQWPRKVILFDKHMLHCKIYHDCLQNCKIALQNLSRRLIQDNVPSVLYHVLRRIHYF